jgi:hypothetical protein
MSICLNKTALIPCSHTLLQHPFPAAHNCTLAAMDAILELSKSLAANGQASLPDGPTSKQDTLPVVLSK